MDFVHVYHPQTDRTDFLLDCDHGTTELTLEGNRESEEATVLSNLIETHRQRVMRQTQGEIYCLCRPNGWTRGE